MGLKAKKQMKMTRCSRFSFAFSRTVSR